MGLDLVSICYLIKYFSLLIKVINCSDLPDNWQDLDEVANVGGGAIFNATGTIYTIGSSTNVMYIAAGGSDDYALNSGFKISMTMELPGDGFNPPASSIDRMVKETWVGIRAMAEKVVAKYSAGHIEVLQS